MTFVERSDAVLGMLARELGIPVTRLRPEMRFTRDLGLDSLGVVRLLIAVEEHLGVELRDTDYVAMRCVGDLLASLQGVTAGSEGPRP